MYIPVKQNFGFSFSIDIKFLTTKASFFDQISFFWFQLCHEQRGRIRPCWKFKCLRSIAISQQSCFKTFTYSITKKPKVFEKHCQLKILCKAPWANKLLIHKIAILPHLTELEIIINEHKFIDFSCNLWFLDLLSEFFGNEDLPLWIIENLHVKILSSDWFKF